MKKIKRGLFYFFITVILVQLFTLIRINDISKSNLTNYHSCTELLSDFKEDKETLNEFFKIIMWNQWQLEGKKIKKGLKLLDTNNTLVALDSLIAKNNNDLLILRFFRSSCEDCQIQEMKMIQKTLNQKNVLVIASFESAKDLMVYVKSQDIQLPVYQLVDTEIMLEDLNEPVDQVFSFLTNSSYEVNMVHIGKSGLPDHSESFYKLIKNKFSTYY